VASQWYGLSKEEKMKIREEAMTMNSKDDKNDTIKMEEVDVWVVYVLVKWMWNAYHQLATLAFHIHLLLGQRRL
jgi:hypothetical protein